MERGHRKHRRYCYAAFGAPISTTTSHDQAQALAHLNACWSDLTAAHHHALAAASGLSDARQHRAVELAALIADGRAFGRRLAFIITADLRYEQQRDS